MASALDTLKQKLTANDIDASTLAVLGNSPEGVMTLVTAGGDPAVELWRRLRGLNSETWHWPVLLGPPDEMGYLSDSLGGYGDGADAITVLMKEMEATRPDPIAWHAEQYGGDELPHAGEPEDGWPGEDAVDESYLIPFDILSREPHVRVLLALVPTRAPWEVPLFLRFGSWNACPSPAQHASLMRRWHQQFGAEVVGITHDVVEMSVARPPTTRAAAQALARDQYAYCSDIVDQGVGSMGALAATLLRAPSWYFWWD